MNTKDTKDTMTDRNTATVDQQRKNTIKAYDRAGIEHACLDDIVETGTTNKQSLYDMLKESEGLKLVDRPLTQEEFDRLDIFRDECFTLADYSISAVSKTATNRNTGDCKPLKKHLKSIGQSDDFIQSVLTACDTKRRLLIACNPWFMIGGSVGANGANDMGSCHHPGSSCDDYKSGAISYGIDKQTLMFGSWEDGGLIGRCLVYVDLENMGIVTGRIFGDITEGDCSYLRKELYALMSTQHKAKDWKKTSDYSVDEYGYRGYLDDGYFQGYRPAHSQTIQIKLVAPMCPSCGEKHQDHSMLCDDCDSLNHYTCDHCGCRIDEDEIWSGAGGDGCYCESCYDDLFFYCDECGETCDIEERVDIDERSSRYSRLCTSCADREGYIRCDSCGEYHTYDMVETKDGNVYCEECLPRGMQRCDECGLYDDEVDMTKTIEGDYFCSDCDGHLDKCEACGQYTNNGLNHRETDDFSVCDECMDEVLTVSEELPLVSPSAIIYTEAKEEYYCEAV